MGMQNWMSHLDGQARLYSVVMPGSHDAGVYGIGQITSDVDANVVRCQFSDFYQQAGSGSRFFDLRVFVQKLGGDSGVSTNAGGLPGNVQLRAGHFAFESAGSKYKFTDRYARSEKKGTPSKGGYGGSLIAVLQDSLRFVEKYTTEFLILRISHAKHPNLIVEAVKFFRTSLTFDQQQRFCTVGDGGSLAGLTVDQLRGKLLLVFSEKEFGGHITPGEGIQRFAKYSDGKTPVGLVTCGKFSGESKSSKLFGSLNMDTIEDDAMSAARKHLQHQDLHHPHLHQVYWQQTGGLFTEKNIKTFTTRTNTGAHSRLGQFVQAIDQLKQANGGRTPVNIISHDFVSPATCAEIIKLNRGYNATWAS